MDSSARLSDERYRAFIENISDGVYETDIYGNYTYFNNALCNIFGYSREEIQWENYSKFMSKKRARKVYEIFNRIWIKLPDVMPTAAILPMGRTMNSDLIICGIIW